MEGEPQTKRGKSEDGSVIRYTVQVDKKQPDNVCFHRGVTKHLAYLQDEHVIVVDDKASNIPMFVLLLLLLYLSWNKPL